MRLMDDDESNNLAPVVELFPPLLFVDDDEFELPLLLLLLVFVVELNVAVVDVVVE